MTLSALRTEVWQRLDEPDDGTGYYSSAEVSAALNRSQRLFVLLSLCLETTGALPLTAALAWYHMRDTFPDWLVPLRVNLGTSKIRPATVAQLAALNCYWETVEGTVERYVHLGLDSLAVYRHPAAPGTSLAVIYARTPVVMSANGDIPEIPEQYHPDLIEAAIPFLRLKEGGQALESALPLMQRFIECAGKAARYVRARSLDLRYDTVPAETITTDLSRALKQDVRRPTTLAVTNA
ncbi:MAG: hypothetical protein V1790_17580 [Planctomycetota bacterium]